MWQQRCNMDLLCDRAMQIFKFSTNDLLLILSLHSIFCKNGWIKYNNYLLYWWVVLKTFLNDVFFTTERSEGVKKRQFRKFETRITSTIRNFIQLIYFIWLHIMGSSTIIFHNCTGSWIKVFLPWPSTAAIGKRHCFCLLFLRFSIIFKNVITWCEICFAMINNCLLLCHVFISL